MVGILYLDLLIALFMVWPGAKQIRSLPFGFSLTSMLDSHSVGWVTGLIIPSPESLFSSSFTRSNFATDTRCFGACTGVTEGSSSICTGILGGFPRPGLNTLVYCRKMSTAVSIPSGGSVYGVCRISSSIAFVSSA